MNLRPVTSVEYDRLMHKLPPLEALIEEFIKMDVDCVEVEHFHHKTAEGAAASIGHACKRVNRGVKCKMIDGKVYLFKMKAEVKE